MTDQRFLDDLLATPDDRARFEELLHGTHGEQPQEHCRNILSMLGPSRWKCLSESDRERLLGDVRIRLAVAVVQLEGAS